MNLMEDRIKAIRHFNRFITRQIGVLNEGLHQSPYSLTEARVLFELAHQRQLTASDLSNQLCIDAGYMSRIMARFEQKGLIDKVRSEADGRQRIIRLSTDGKEAARLLDEKSHDEVAQMLESLGQSEQSRLLKAMQAIETLLDKRVDVSLPYILRSHEPGDMGFVTYRHGVLYAEEYGWDEHFEALVAKITSDFINNFCPGKERCWIAERDGEMVGSIFVVRESEAVAKLRLLLVEPRARGLGLGTRLVQESIRFAKKSGYQKLVLWTNSVLTSARNIYKKAGFELVSSEPHQSFGHDLVGETWELKL